MILLIDIDGVLRDLMSKLRAEYRKRFKNVKLLPITDYNLEPFFKGGDNVFDFLFNSDSTFRIYSEAKPYNGAIEAIDKLKDNHKIKLITSQPNIECIAATIAWLDINNVHYDDLIFTHDKSEYIGDYLFDDKIENLQNAKHAKPICVYRPWNRAWTGSFIRNFNYLNVKTIIGG